MLDELSIPVMSLTIAKKRKDVRDALYMRHRVGNAHIHNRLANLYDWTWRMAAKMREDKGKKLEKPKFIGFFNCDIPSDKKDECKAFIRKEEEIALLIEQAIASSYKISVALNETNGSVQATMTCNDAGSKNAGYAMSAYAPHWYNAIAVLLWKHYVLLGGVWKQPELGELEDFG